MKHTHPDDFALRSPLAFDARVKLVFTFALLCTVAVAESAEAILIGLAFVLCLAAISGIPALHTARCFAGALPFIFAATLSSFFSGWQAAAVLCLRITTAVLATTLLVTTTPFFEMLAALQRLHVPQVFVQMLMFTYRYIFVLSGESYRMAQARKARGFSRGTHLFDARGMAVISSSIGIIFVRAAERAERISDALRMRVYNGTAAIAGKSKIGWRDVAFAACFSAVSFLIIIAGAFS